MFVYSVFKNYSDIQSLRIQNDKIVCSFVSYSCCKLCTLSGMHLILILKLFIEVKGTIFTEA